MATFRNIDGEEPGTVTFTVSAVELTRNSSAELQEIVSLGDPDISTNVARILSVAPASTMAGLGVRIISGPSTATDFSVRALLPSTYGDHALRVLQSTAADLNVTVAGYSTTVNISSVAGPVIMRSSAADAKVNPLNSTYGDLTVRAAQSTATDLLVTAHGNQSSNSSVYLPVRLTNGTGFLTVGNDYIHGSTVSTLSTNLSAPGLMLRTGSDGLSNTNLFTMLRGSTAGALHANLVTDSGVSVMDSTNSAVKVNVVAGSAAGDTTVTASFAAGYVSSGAPAAGSSALVVRQVGYSTTVNVSSLAGPVIVRSSAADQLVTVYQSTAADLAVTASQNSTAWSVLARVTTSSGGGVEGSTQTPPTAGIGLLVRQVPSSFNSTAVVVTSSNSTVLLPILTSVASAQRVHAYFVSVSTSANVSTIIFMSGSTNHVWPVVASSGYFGANLAVTPPAELFRANAGEALNVVIQNAATAVTARIGVSWRQDA